MPRHTQARSFMVTVWHKTPEEFLSGLDTNVIKYGIWQLEKAPSTGELHIQGYFEFRKPMRVPAVKRAVASQSAHVEERNGTPQEAKDYCSKEETREEGPWEVRGLYVDNLLTGFVNLRIGF